MKTGIFVGMVFLIIALAVSAGASEFKPTKMLPAIQAFTRTIDGIAQSELSPREKAISAERTRQVLLSEARALYGPFEDLTGLGKAAKDYIRHFVNGRRMRFEGVDLQTFLRLTEASKKDRAVYDGLMDYGWRLSR